MEQQEGACDIFKAGGHNGDVRARLGRIFGPVRGDDAASQDPGLDILLRGASSVRFDPGQFVFRAGETCDAFLISLAGIVRVQLSSSSGREVTLYRVKSGNSCSLASSCILNRDVYPAEAVAESDVEAIAITADRFQEALGRSELFRQYVFNGYSPNLTDILAKVEQLSFKSIDTRLSNVLLDLHEKGEQRVTHRELAVELGTAREVISRKLKQFEIAGLIRLARGRITVSDPGGLMSLGDSLQSPSQQAPSSAMAGPA